MLRNVHKHSVAPSFDALLLGTIKHNLVLIGAHSGLLSTSIYRFPHQFAQWLVELLASAAVRWPRRNLMLLKCSTLRGCDKKPHHIVFLWFSYGMVSWFPHRLQPKIRTFSTAALHSSCDFGISEKAAGGKDLAAGTNQTRQPTPPAVARLSMDLKFFLGKICNIYRYIDIDI